MSFTFSTVASSLHDAATVGRIIEPVGEVLAAAGGHAVDEPTDEPTQPHLVLVATGGTEQAILDVVGRRRAVVADEPVVLVAHARHNSLPAALEASARLRAEGVRVRIVQADDSDRVAEAVGDVAAVHALRGARLGLVGAPSEWLVASVPDPDALRERWGISLVDVDIGDTIRRHRSVDPVAARPVAVRFSTRRAPDDDTMTAASLHPALVGTIERHSVDAVAVRCFDFLTELGTSGCVALAELNDTGVVAGCEGDVASTVAMMLVRELLDAPSWVANPASVDPVRDEVVLAHCTVAPSMVDGVELHTHFESGIGVGLRGEFAPGWVTLLRLGGSALERHWFADAEVVANGSSPDLCRTQVTVRLADRHADELLDEPLGNHLVLVRGRHRRRLERWCQLAFG